MKLRLEIKCSNETSIGKLVKIFFEDSKTSDYIEVKNSTVKLEIEENEGDDRKKKIIEAIDEWKNVTLNYGILSDSACEERNQSNEVETKKEEKKYQKNKKVLKVPKLEAIAKKSSSFKEFIELTAEWLEMGDYKELFYNVVMAAAESEKVISRIVIEQKNMNLDSALEQIAKTYNLDLSKEIQLKMSQLLNSYVQKYDKDRKVKTETFFTELQKVIM